MHVAWSYCQQLGLLPYGKPINWRNLKKKSLLERKKTKIKINGMFNECFYLCNLVFSSVLLVSRMLRHLSPATAVLLRVPTGILDLENVRAGFGTELMRFKNVLNGKRTI